VNGRLSFCVLKLDWGEASEAAEPLAFNQGFYNLFLAVGALLGVLLVALDAATAGWTLVVFSCASMVGAALVGSLLG